MLRRRRYKPRERMYRVEVQVMLMVKAQWVDAEITAEEKETEDGRHW